MNIDEIWKDDLLGRRDDASFLIRFLTGRIEERGVKGLPRSYVLNLDAAWGEGKTFFLDRFEKHLEAEGYLVAKVNAWRDDHAEDPLLAVMASIDDVVIPLIKKREKTKKSWRAVKRTGAAVITAAAKGAVLHWVRKGIGDGLDDVMRELGDNADEQADAVAEAVSTEIKSVVDRGAETLLAQFKEARRSIETFRNELKGFLQVIATEERKMPLFVLVDELDRCRPLYAITLLERVKHLFDIDDIVFVIATNTDQLRHTIGAIYGAEFDSQRYLFRFFDRTYFFEEPQLEQFVAALMQRYQLDAEKISVPPGSKIEAFVADACAYFNLSLRDAEQCFDILRSVRTVWPYSVPIELVVLFPMIIGYRHRIDPTLSADFPAQMQSFAAREKPRPPTWEFSFTVHDYRERPIRERVRVSWAALFSDFARASSATLPKLLEGGGSGPGDDWVNSRLQHEFQVLHRGTWSGNGPMSILAAYPKIVRTAGRLLHDATQT